MTHLTTPTWIEINQRAFEHNITQYKNLIGPHVLLGVVVKSNAYGHGLVEIGSLCQKNNSIDWLCTSLLSEALMLRSHGVTKPILVMSIVDADIADAITHSIDLMVYTKSALTMLNAIGQKLKQKARVHIKIDTGMSRFGIHNHEALDLIAYALQLPSIAVHGLYTHLAEADNEDETFTRQQLATFNQVVHELKQNNIHIPFIHATNSAGTVTLANNHCNLVRIGAGVYGLPPSAAIQKIVDLKPVMTWKTTIMDVRTLPAHSSVGYRRTYQTSKLIRMGFIPVGYYEGYDRRLSNKGITAIVDTHGSVGYAPIMGRICMNVSMIDITHSNADIGSTVVLLGDYDQTRAADIANRIESFNPREITTRINPLIKRIIVT